MTNTPVDGVLTVTLNAWRLEMSPRQQELVQAISEYVTRHGFQPTQAELAATLKVSRSRVEQMVSALERKGIVHRKSGHARTLRVMSPA